MTNLKKVTNRKGRSRPVQEISFAAFVSLLVCFVLLSCPLALLRAAASKLTANTVSTATVEGRLAVFDDVWQTINDRYYDPHFHGVDWWAQRTQFRTLAANARDRMQLYEVLRRLLTSLRDAHTRVYSPEQKFDWEHPRFVTAGLSLREVEGLITVVGVERDSAARRQGIRAGDVVQTIDGENALTLLARKLSEQTESSTPQVTRLFAVSSLIGGPAGTTVAIEWLDAAGRLHKALLPRAWQQRTLGIRLTHRDGIAVIEIDGFTRDLVVEFARASQTRLGKARGIVLDLRNNGGGDAQAMAELASTFLPGAMDLGQFTDRNGNLFLKLETALPLLSVHPERLSRKIPIIILTSERTSSAAEIFTAVMKQAGRAAVFGGQTCGCVLAVRTRHELPDGGELEVSELDYHTALGVRLEGSGLKPDETVNLTRHDLYARRDLALISAVAGIRAVR